MLSGQFGASVGAVSVGLGMLSSPARAIVVPVQPPGCLDRDDCDRSELARRHLEEEQGCGGGRSGPDHEGRVKRPSVKQGLDGEAA